MKRGARRPAKQPELTDWQAIVLDRVSRTVLARAATFGGATALSVVHFHHRRSEDLDFFLPEPATPKHVGIIESAGRALGYGVEVRELPTRWSIVLDREGKAVGHVDLAHYPYDPVAPPTRWRGLRVESLLDMTVNKVQAMLTRARDRDFVDLYFLLREGPERDLWRLLALARAKFDFGPNPIALAEGLLRAESVSDLPEMIRGLTLEEMKAYFRQLARDLVRAGPRPGK